MAQQDQATPDQQASAALQDFFDRQVAEAMPAAFDRALGGPSVLAGWIYRAASAQDCGHFGPLDPADDLLLVGSLSVPTLLVLLFDKRQPVEITAAVRDALLHHFLSDSDIQKLIQTDALIAARRSVQKLASDSTCAERDAAVVRAERQSLYGAELPADGVSEVPGIGLARV